MIFPKSTADSSNQRQGQNANPQTRYLRSRPVASAPPSVRPPSPLFLAFLLKNPLPTVTGKSRCPRSGSVRFRVARNPGRSPVRRAGVWIMLDNSVQIFIALFGGYVVTSMLLLRHPTILHRKKKIKFTCRHISHRGGAGEGYENTLSTFKRALAIGTDMLELDCQLTKDRKVVVCHDNNLMRAAGINKNISDLNYDDLPPIKSRLPVDFDPGTTFSGSESEEERRIPLLHEVFKHFPRTPINIDVKVNNDLLIDEINRLIVDFRREDVTVWGSFSNAITKKCYKKNPRVNLLFSLKQVLRLIALFYCGLLPFFPIKETHLEIFQPAMYLHPSWRNHCKKSDGHFLVFWSPLFVQYVDRLLMNKSLFQHLKKRGIQTYVWVINDETQFKKLYDLGVTGIMTDYPTKLKIFLDQHPEYSISSEDTFSTASAD